MMLSACAVYPQSDAVMAVNQHMYEHEDTIEVYDCMGGTVSDFMRLGEYAVESNKLVRWHGNVISACTVTADIIRNNDGRQCLVSDRVVFGYHQARYDDGTYVANYSDYMPDTVVWMKSKGGLPIGEPLLVLKGEDLLKFYKMCE